MHFKGFRSVTCTSTRLSANGMNHAFASLPSQRKLVVILLTRRHGRLSRPSWLVTYLDGLPVRRRSPIKVLTEPDVDKFR